MLIYNLINFDNMMINLNVIATARNWIVWTIRLILLASLTIAIALIGFRTIFYQTFLMIYGWCQKFKHIMSDICFDYPSEYWKAVDGFSASSYW